MTNIEQPVEEDQTDEVCVEEDVSSPLKSILDNVRESTVQSVNVPTDFDNIMKILKEEEDRKVEAADKRPDISHLEDAVLVLEDGLHVFVPDVGERVIIEKYATLMDGGWLNTRVYVVHSIDHESGRIKLWDVENQQWSFNNFIEGLKHGYKFKLPTPAGRVPNQRRRARTEREKELEANEPKPQKVLNKSGRKPGTKNRPPEVIAAERVEKEKILAERRARRELRKLRKYVEEKIQKTKAEVKKKTRRG